MIAYASRTGTRRNLAALRRRGWRLFVSARGVLRTEGFRFALDNGAWTAFQEFLKGLRPTADPDLAAFVKAVDLLGASADFIVVPDIVEGGTRSWAMTRFWLRRLRRDRRLKGVRLMISVQDGFPVELVAPYLSKRIGVFVGGSTEWKLKTMAAWAGAARARGARCHVARVNSAKRIEAVGRAGAHSFDGSNATRFAKNIPHLEAARHSAVLDRTQISMDFEEAA